MSYEQDVINCIPSLRRFGMTILKSHDKVDDIVQDVMVKALSKRHQYKEGTNLKGWLMTILRNEVYSKHRVSKRETTVDPDGALAISVPDLPTQEIKVYWNEFNYVFDQMQPDQKRSIILIAIEGFTYEEVAAMENVPEGTVKSRVARGRAFLKEHMSLPDPDHISLGVISHDDNQRSNYRG